MIKVSGLTKKYGERVAVDNISFTVGKNEVVGFLGPNGAGKSTTIKVLTSFHSASSGVVEIAGYNVLTHPEIVKKHIGYLPENVPLYPEMRIFEYLEYRAGLKGILAKNRKKEIERVLNKCQISDVKNRIIGQLSKGYRQRVGLADALIADPPILILDEPTVGLDPSQIREIRELIKELGKNRTVILSSHILPEIEAVCSRVIIINKGKIAEDKKTSDLKATNLGVNIDINLELINSKPYVDCKEILRKNINGIQIVSEENSTDIIMSYEITKLGLRVKSKNDRGVELRENIFDALVKNNIKIVGMYQKSVTLEDIFVDIVTDEKIETNLNTEENL
ncbi:MAG: ATP-binding cassette domain-containing protein [Deltaproteobacteria bacterium]|nr:ATP-binding cassette domain-containing protein [Deltaproteobacteria bacterium]